SEVVKVSSCWGYHYDSHVGDHINNKQGSNLTVNSDDTWVYLSTDGAVARDSGYATTGGVARHRRIIIMTDNLEVAQILTDMDLEDSGITVLRRTHRILQSERGWMIKHIPRNQNLVADRLAKLSFS
ncbi:hypothetical protein Gohar_018354, partial [Gossypium harknessii]|nr:hypothetical protein [Gossypium harknessii]